MPAAPAGQNDSGVLGKRNTAERGEEEQEEENSPKRGTADRRSACERCRDRKCRCDQERPCGACNKAGVAAECKYPSKQKVRDINEVLGEILTRVTRVDNQMGQVMVAMPRNSIEPHSNDLEIPHCVAIPDKVLNWPVFDGKYLPNCLIAGLNQARVDPEKDPNYVPNFISLPHGFENEISNLIGDFLSNVHTKNPVLDVKALKRDGKIIAKHGMGYDARTCLVMLACALGAISQPFVQDLGRASPFKRNESSANIFKDDLKKGEAYYHQAARRLGLVKSTVLGAQCHFFAGVYLMYTFHPHEAWVQFYQASVNYHFFLKSIGGPDDEQFSNNIKRRLQVISDQERRIEQSMYWTCFKSEVELRIELPLMQSSIIQFEYPDALPTPPQRTRRQKNAPSSPNWHQTIENRFGNDVSNLGLTESTRNVSNDLNSEQLSWYYYLTEVALRRIGNQIINTIYRVPQEAWLDIHRWISIAEELDEQINRWANVLPSHMQFLSPENSNSGARLQEDANRIAVAQELSWCTENRLLEMRIRLYQPFLYCAIHRGRTALNTQDQERVLPPAPKDSYERFVQAGIACHLKTLRWRTSRHRHHGIWFDLRAVMTSVIVLCAAAKSRKISIPDCLFARESFVEQNQPPPCDMHEGSCISFDRVFDCLKYWEKETLDLQESRCLLQVLVGETRSQLSDRPVLSSRHQL